MVPGKHLQNEQIQQMLRWPIVVYGYCFFQPHHQIYVGIKLEPYRTPLVLGRYVMVYLHLSWFHLHLGMLYLPFRSI